MRPWIHRSFLVGALTVAYTLRSPSALANGKCPAFGQSPSCSVLVTIERTGLLKVEIDGAVPPYDGVEDILVGVQNNSGATVFGIALEGTGIFGFDGDGAFNGAYSGPDVTF